MPRISKTDACTLIQQYRDSGGWDNGQTKCAWFSNQDITEILGMTSEFGADGMHIYIAKYPATEMPGAPDPAKYVNRITVVFVPTVNGQDIFNVEDPPNAGTNMKAMMASGGSGDPAYDHGTLQP